MSKTPRNFTRQRVSEYVKSFPSTHGYLPTLRDIRMGLRMASAEAVRYHLLILRDEGRVMWDGRMFTTVKWVKEAEAA